MGTKETRYSYRIRFRSGETFFPWAIDVFRDGTKLGKYGGLPSGWTDFARSERDAHRRAKKIIRLDRKHLGTNYSVEYD